MALRRAPAAQQRVARLAKPARVARRLPPARLAKRAAAPAVQAKLALRRAAPVVPAKPALATPLARPATSARLARRPDRLVLRGSARVRCHEEQSLSSVQRRGRYLPRRCVLWTVVAHARLCGTMNHPKPQASFALAVASVVAVSACGARFDPAHFEGSSEPRRTEPEALRELVTRTSELTAIGGVHASCALQPGFRRLEGESLSDVDCGAERLDFALRESAANAGGDALIGVHCNSRRLGTTSRETHRLSCSAEVARFSGKLASERPLAVPGRRSWRGPLRAPQRCSASTSPTRHCHFAFR